MGTIERDASRPNRRGAGSLFVLWPARLARHTATPGTLPCPERVDLPADAIPRSCPAPLSGERVWCMAIFPRPAHLGSCQPV